MSDEPIDDDTDVYPDDCELCDGDGEVKDLALGRIVVCPRCHGDCIEP